MDAGGQWGAAIESGDVIEAEKAAFEDVAIFGIFAVDPPGEIQEQLVEDALEEFAIALVAVHAAVDLINAPGSPSVDRRVHIAEGPFVGG